ncbi:MAG: hypothetical protein M1827_003803 [Pycnora praestabilis]|nr:MAG: hypothetical protein M1827_003803 [Pycnora praestabilis]
MPARDMAVSVGMDPAYNPPLFKAHRILPRRRDHLPTVNPSPANPQPARSAEDRYLANSSPRGEKPRISLPNARSQKVLPLTPPSNPHSSDGRANLDRSPTRDGDMDLSYVTQNSGLSTPLNQRSPPTPDVTPPKAQVKVSTLHPPQVQRYPSSRADSFTTAREDQVSSDEDASRLQSEPSHTRHTWADATRSARLKEIGLGLGLNLEGAPVIVNQEILAKDHGTDDFVTFDGTWGSEVEDREWDSNLMRNVTVRKKSQKRPKISTNIAQDHENSSFDDISTPNLIRGLSLRERIQRRKHSPTSASTERFAEQIEWPAVVDDLLRGTQTHDIDAKRLSGMSGTSTIVEAIVVDSPPQRQRTLRHTGKNVALHKTSLSSDRSNRSSLISNSQSHRLVHRHSKIPDRANMFSFGSETSESIVSIPAKSHRDSIPVIVIPQRRSSLKSSSTGSGNHSRSQSSASGRHPSQPTSAPDNTVGYFDVPPRRLRHLSDPMSSAAATSRQESQRGRDFSPTIPQRSSSLSAPTSRTASRTTSLTSASLKSRKRDVVAIHRKAVSQLVTPEPSAYTAPSQNQHLSTGGWSFLRPPSTQYTPFSQPSITSSSPEAHEVSEAMAVSIYPHHNQSLLIVQHQARPVLEIPKHLLAPLEHPFIAEEELMTPPMIGQSRALVESPLKNPRKPPLPPSLPPAFKVIPPTPANGTPCEEADRQLDGRSATTGNDQRQTGALSLLKRTLSNRRYSESFISPFTRSRTFRSISKDRRPVPRDERENKLHPFWRPRGFWDDFDNSDSDEDFGNDGFLISNSLINQPRSFSQSGGRRLSFSLSHRRQSEVKTIRAKTSSGSMRVQKLPAKPRVHSFPTLGVQVEYIGFKGFQERLRKVQEKKQDRKREADRAKLRSSIGARIVMPDARIA